MSLFNNCAQQEIDQFQDIDKNEISYSAFENLITSQLRNNNPLQKEIINVAYEQLKNALTSVDDNTWELFVKDDNMQIYRKDFEEENGIACDPLKAVHFVKGVSAKEYIDKFFDSQIKSEWDDTLVKIDVLETVEENTIIIHQLHKRIWPAAQRESLFWSQKLDLTKYCKKNSIEAFFVCNHDIDRSDVPLHNSSNIRVKLNIAMLCQTIVSNSAKLKNINDLTRDDIICKIIYVAQIHPGGWVPTAALRQISKREYPKFLRQFSAYVFENVKSQPLNLKIYSL